MIAYFLLGLGLLIGILFLGRWFADAEPRQVKRLLVWLGGGLGLVAALFLLWAGRHGLAALLLPVLLPAIMRLRGLLGPGHLGSEPRSGGGQTSEIHTEMLRMALDHETGVLSGEVKRGRFAGHRLDQLTLDDLTELWRDCQREDPHAASLLEGYLDRVHGPGWRAGSGGGDFDGRESGAEKGAQSGGPMTAEEARAILGVAEEATDEEIRAAYRHLMQKLHPDHGGSTYLASQINEARRVLTGE